MGGGGAGGMGAGGDATPVDQSGAVFDPDKLHIISIEVDSKYLAQLDADTENRVPCKVTFDDQIIKDAGCRKKGGYGSVQPLSGKTGFSLKFDEFIGGQTLFGLKKVLLNNAVQDPSFLNEHIGYEVYRRAGIPAARTAHGVVRFNGLTKGVFVIAESFDKSFLARNFGEVNKQGNLYEAPPYSDFVTNPDSLELKDEVEDKRSRDDINALSSVAQSAADAELEEEVGKKLDFDGFITGYAIDSIVDHWDGYSILVVNNYYLFDNPSTGRFVYMPHGMDQLFQDPNYSVDTWPKGRLAERVRQIPALDAKFHARIQEVLTDIWDVPSLHARIDKVTAILATNTNMDPAAQSDIASYNAHVQGTRDAIAYRKSLLLAKP